MHWWCLWTRDTRFFDLVPFHVCPSSVGNVLRHSASPKESSSHRHGSTQQFSPQSSKVNMFYVAPRAREGLEKRSEQITRFQNRRGGRSRDQPSWQHGGKKESLVWLLPSLHFEIFQIHLLFFWCDSLLIMIWVVGTHACTIQDTWSELSGIYNWKQ